ncbi:alkaline phosphatase family protein [Granulicella cerasi]|uniref:Alkaline phosphatase family protein n=1 Tax=Granulicella cerasi TaxID=741063 RepID=A0ABW1Z6Y7_9BACT|nr:alkaline phosphatase family protein [Granulicella cerasi]
MKIFARALALLSVASILTTSTAAHADAYDAKPKLVIVLVFDQFRGDYLDRWRADFKAKRGWNLFLNHGAHFTDCYYDYGNLITAAGHTTIGTGAYTDGHHIPDNEWRELGTDGKYHTVESITDSRYTLVGEPAGHDIYPGVSPQREQATTLGDELVIGTNGKARLFGVSLKDRAAVLTSGHASQAAYWVDKDTGAWITSSYWMSKLPDWVEQFNATEPQKARAASGKTTGSFYGTVGRTPASVDYQLDFAMDLIKHEHLGNNPAGVADMLTISISSTDINGHAVGPDDPSQRALIDASDVSLDRFFTELDKEVGLNNVLIAFTGDHGVASSPAAMKEDLMPVPQISAGDFTKSVEASLEKRFPKKGDGQYALGYMYPYLQLNMPLLKANGVKEEDAENATREALLEIFASYAKHDIPNGRAPMDPYPTIFTTTEMRDGRLPQTQLGRLVAHSYSPYVGWAVWMNFGPYQFPHSGDTIATTHFTANSYDRHVPLDFYGSAIIPGTYHTAVAPVDIAATFASLLRINRPSAAVGRVVTEALKPEAAGVTYP